MPPHSSCTSWSDQRTEGKGQSLPQILRAALEGRAHNAISFVGLVSVARAAELRCRIARRVQRVIPPFNEHPHGLDDADCRSGRYSYPSSGHGVLLVTTRALDVWLAISTGYKRRRVSVDVVEVVGQGVCGVPCDLPSGDRSRPVTGDGRAPDGGGIRDVRNINGMAVCKAETLIQPCWCRVHPVDGFHSVSRHTLNGYGSVMARKTNCGAVQLICLGIGAGPVGEAGIVRWCRERITGFRGVSLADEVAAPQNHLASAGVRTAIALRPTMGSMAGRAAMTIDVVSTEDVIRNREPLGHRCPGTSDGEDQ